MVVVSIFCFFFGPNVLQKARFFSPFWFLFPRDFLVFFLFFLLLMTPFSSFFSDDDEERSEGNESFLFFQPTLSSRSEFLFSEFLFFERRSDARGSLLRGEKRTRTRSRSREPFFLWREMNSLQRRELEMRKTNSLVFFLNPSRKKEKGARSLEISARARALCLTANAKKREGKKRSKSIAYLYLHAFVCFLFARVLFSFFLRAFCFARAWF